MIRHIALAARLRPDLRVPLGSGRPLGSERMMQHVRINSSFCSPEHQPVTLEAFDDDGTGYWSCCCGAHGSVRVGPTVRTVRIATRVASAFHRHSGRYLPRVARPGEPIDLPPTVGGVYDGEVAP